MIRLKKWSRVFAADVKSKGKLYTAVVPSAVMSMTWLIKSLPLIAIADPRPISGSRCPWTIARRLSCVQMRGPLVFGIFVLKEYAISATICFWRLEGQRVGAPPSRIKMPRYDVIWSVSLKKTPSPVLASETPLDSFKGILSAKKQEART